MAAGNWKKEKSKTFNDAVNRWITEHFPNLKKSSIKRYSVSINNLLEVFDGTSLDDMGNANFSRFEQHRRANSDTEITESTIRRDFACLSSLLSSCEEWEWIDVNKVKAYVRGRSKRRLLTEGPPHTRYLSKPEENAALAVCAPKAQQSIEFAIDTGLRKEEQFSLLKTDILVDTWEVLVRPEVAKSAKSRKVPLLPRAKHLVEAILAENTDSPYLFTTYLGDRYSPTSPTMYEALQKACRKSNVPHCSWHDLRRTCGCRLLQDYGMTMLEVSKWLGHSSVKVTERHYAFLAEDQLREKVRMSTTHTDQIELQKQHPHLTHSIKSINN